MCLSSTLVFHVPRRQRTTDPSELMLRTPFPSMLSLFKANPSTLQWRAGQNLGPQILTIKLWKLGLPWGGVVGKAWRDRTYSSATDSKQFPLPFPSSNFVISQQPGQFRLEYSPQYRAESGSFAWMEE